ncbi:AAA family ATPase [Mycolicibacterium frederiksbergense]|uniref:AAA family ATPase n=1 Tax=Mycolicibacterium frederiksbergense TaxID=117567 RepID=UPI00265C2091|nr:AAA family ATPase [Mycolicibacterium frederiksbergense]MDO0976019.1 hypothetical protein [Mycolicibacterium frederiksbergense]
MLAEPASRGDTPEQGHEKAALLHPDVLDRLMPDSGWASLEQWRANAAPVLPTMDPFDLGMLELGGERECRELDKRAREHRDGKRIPVDGAGQGDGSLELRRYAKRAEAAERDELAELAAITSGVNTDLYNTVLRLDQLYLYLSPEDHKRNRERMRPLYVDACCAAGLVARDGEPSVHATIDSAFNAVDRSGELPPLTERRGDHGHADDTVRVREPLPTGAAAAQDAEPSDDDDRPPLYADVARFLAGELPDPPTPTVLARQDGRQLFYRGQVNTVFGDPESGKTFVALAACAESLCAGGRALFFDLDHNTMPAIVLRLIMLGVPREILADSDRFRYCEPMGAVDLHQVVDDCAGWRPDVVVVDSLGELLPMLGASSDSADDFTMAHAKVLKPLARCGAAVIVVDHLAKSPTSRVHGPGGTMAKRRVLGGVSLRVKVGRAFAPGKGGTAHLILNKDRHGGVRAHCPSGEREPMAGTFVLDGPDADGVCAWRVLSPLPTLNVDERGREYLGALREASPAAVSAEQLAELVSGEPPATKAQIEKARHWLTKLTEDGHAEIAREGGRGKPQTLWAWSEPRPAFFEQPGVQAGFFDPEAADL